jgi:threonylcarbamoyladenosine tRNA methylthiotransferase MtaB
MITFSSFAFGCRVNEAEKEALDKKMIEAGFYFAEKNPDIFIVNTCAITHKAEREARNLIYQIKRKNPKTKIVITGCSATYWQKNKLYENLPIDLLVDNTNKEFLVELIKKRLLNQKKSCHSRESGNLYNRFLIKSGMTNLDNKLQPFKSVEYKLTSKFLTSKRLLVKIQDGCQRFCTFCIVPYLRGLPKSRKIEEIVKEINNYYYNISLSKWESRDLSVILNLFQDLKRRFRNKFGMTNSALKDRQIASDKTRQGFLPHRIQHDKTPISEVILTAINTEAFGLDTGESFIDLIEKVLEKTSIPRLSFGSIHPWSITPQFINFYQKILTTTRLVNFFHIPLQSGSNTILKLMKRGYTKEEILEKLSALQKINPLSLLATDVIVGFLGETEREFEETYRFLEKSPLVKFHIFRFSKRKNTAAFYMAKTINEPTEEEKKKRAKALAELFAKKYFKFLEKNLGRLSTALILNKKENGFYEALLDNQLPILIEKNKNIIPGEIVKVKVERIKDERLVGKVDKNLSS